MVVKRLTSATTDITSGLLMIRLLTPPTMAGSDEYKRHRQPAALNRYLLPKANHGR
jgi:hypothetical protein